VTYGSKEVEGRHVMASRNKQRRRKVRRVRVRAERRSEPDWDRFAWALLQYTKSVSSKKERPKP
jgi:hypothetical protein